VRSLLLAKARVDRQDSNGNEVLMLLALKAQDGVVDSKLVSVLALAGCDPTLTNDEGFCAAELFEGANLEALKQGLRLRVRRREDVLDNALEEIFGEDVEERVLDTILLYDQKWPTPIGRRGSEEERMTTLLRRVVAPKEDADFPGNMTVDVVDGEVELDEIAPAKVALNVPLLASSSN